MRGERAVSAPFVIDVAVLCKIWSFSTLNRNTAKCKLGSLCFSPLLQISLVPSYFAKLVKEKQRMPTKDCICVEILRDG